MLVYRILTGMKLTYPSFFIHLSNFCIAFLLPILAVLKQKKLFTETKRYNQSKIIEVEYKQWKLTGSIWAAGNGSVSGNGNRGKGDQTECKT